MPTDRLDLPSPTDLPSLARHALSLTTEVEKIWSAALDADQLELAQRGTTAALQALTQALVNAASDRDRRLSEKGVDIVLHEWPPSAESVLAWDVDAPDETLRFRLAMMVEVAAVEFLIQAVSGLVEPGSVELDLIAGVELRRWWDSGGFALARSRGRLLETVSAEVAAAERRLLDTSINSDDREWERRAFEGAQAAGVAYGRGDPEAALLHLLRSARAVIAQVSEEAAYTFSWAQLERVPELALIGRLLARAERHVSAMISSPTAVPAALLLARVLLPHIRRWAVAVPRDQIASAIREGQTA